MGGWVGGWMMGRWRRRRRFESGVIIGRSTFQREGEEEEEEEEEEKGDVLPLSTTASFITARSITTVPVCLGGWVGGWVGGWMVLERR